MAFLDDLTDLMPDTASWKPFVSRSRAGKPTYGTATAIPNCRLVEKHQMVRDKNGDEVLSSAHLWIPSDEAITPESEVTLSDSTTPPIISVLKIPDEKGDKHTKVFFR